VNTLECIADVRRASVLLDPLRLRILECARQPASSTEIAARLSLPRQKVNYHVRALHRARFLERAGQKKKRNLIERRFQATAEAYVLAPEVLGPAGADTAKIEDTFSAAYLMALASRLHSELGRVSREADAEGKRLSTLSISADLRFQSAEERARFADALHAAVIDVIARFTTPTEGGRPYRLVVGCYPTPPEEKTS